MSIPSAASLPPDLKLISPYLARAQELHTAEPIISYWCTYYALQQAMSIGSSAPDSQTFLLGLMDQLEAVKAENADNEAFTSDPVASAYIENFGLKIFAVADGEDRKGKASRVTARKFLAAANFLELLSIFGEASSENKDKIRYSKWKAADIARALREGRTPTPGPAGGLEPEETEGIDVSKQAENDGIVAAGTEEEKELKAELAAMTTPPVEADGSAASDEADESYPFPQPPSSLPSASASASALSPPPDFIDLPPAPSAPEPPSHAVTPIPPSFLSTPATSAPSTPGGGGDGIPGFVPIPQVPESHQTRELQPPHHSSSSSAGFASAVFPPAPAPPPASAPPLSPAPAPAPARMQGTESYDPATVAKVQKHAKWAISALDYEDWETARGELRKALGILGG
ncbi:hypothetical protein JCM11641_004389 [Rhodosporidiobolus odoratus]